MPPYTYICAGTDPFGVFVNDDSFTIIDLANPLVPAFTGNIAGAGAPNWLGAPTHLAIQDNYAYVCAYGDDRLTVIDITNPAAPAFVASLNVPGIYDIKISGNHAFVVTDWMNQLISIDITNPLVPAVDDTVVHGWGNPVSIYIQDDRAYISARDATLHIFDISNPSAIAFLGEAIVGIDGACVIIDGIWAYVTDYLGNWFYVVNVSNPAIIVTVGAIGGAGAPNHMNGLVGLDKVGNLVYVCAFGENYFNIIDVTNPAVPTITGQLDIWTAMGFLNSRPKQAIVIGNYAYVTVSNGLPAASGLIAIDISNPATPFIAGFIMGGGAPNFLALAYGLAIPIYPPIVRTDPATEIT